MGAREVRAAVEQLKSLAENDPEVYKSVVADLLGAIDPTQSFGTALHNRICELSISVAFEPVMLRRNEGGEIEVYLLQRSMDDTMFPGQHYVGGNFERPGDESPQAGAIARSAEKFGCDGLEVTFLDSLEIKDERGPLRARIHLVTPVGEPANGRWVRVTELDNLEGGLVPSHKNIYIPMAVTAFEG